MAKSIQTQAIITGIRSKVDRSLGLSVSTPELSTPEKALFMELQGLNVDLTITPLEGADVEAERIDKDMETKTSSQRLRAVLYIYWKQQGGAGEFDEFYKSHMEKFIDHVKTKLDQ
jgi:hypothetical protein